MNKYMSLSLYIYIYMICGRRRKPGTGAPQGLCRPRAQLAPARVIYDDDDDYYYYD